MSTTQTTTTPYWNEILDITMPSPLPDEISICLETWTTQDPVSKDIAEFEISVNPSLEIGLGEAKLVPIKTRRIFSFPPFSSSLELPGGSRGPSTLRVTCSFDRELVNTRQRGLWPLIRQCENIFKAAIIQPIVPQEPDFPLLATTDSLLTESSDFENHAQTNPLGKPIES
jgi:hypothetical protein